MLTKATKIYKGNGFSHLCWRVSSYFYKRVVRRHLPDMTVVNFAGVKIPRFRKLGDTFFEDRLFDFSGFRDRPEYEAGLVKALVEYAKKGDKVVVIGGGLGVTCVVAAKAVGPRGSVLCFEGSFENVQIVKQTAALNGMPNIVVRHTVVETNIGVYGGGTSDELAMSAKDLPPCDFLEMDCEGAEVRILQDMTIRPRVIVVETHGCFGSPTCQIAASLTEIGYAVRDLGWAEPGLLSACQERDIRVLVATKIIREEIVSDVDSGPADQNLKER